MRTYADLFTNRQLTALTTLSDLVLKARNRIVADGASSEYGIAVSTYLALAVSRLSDYASTITTWASNPQMEILRNTFARQALPMTFDFAESNIFGPSSGTLDILVSAIYRTITLLPVNVRPGFAEQRSATDLDLKKGYLIATDPPYYDNIGYADLSDYFYVWLRLSLGKVYSDLMGTMVTPKSAELIADPTRHGSKTRRANSSRAVSHSSLGWRAKMRLTSTP